MFLSFVLSTLTVLGIQAAIDNDIEVEVEVEMGEVIDFPYHRAGRSTYSGDDGEVVQFPGAEEEGGST
tara:strand:+ start:446 stop:649 length:204 start_codon:yes stop_codon:yes gene_type:complete